MKGFRLIFAGCLAPLVLYGALADTGATSSRATVRREATQSSARDTKSTVSRTTTSGRPRTVTQTRAPITPSRVGVSRTSTGRSAIQTPIRGTVSNARAARTTSARAATNATAISNILGKDYSKCRTIFNECMDEFCANKDAQLHRCACSSRIHEFDDTKKQLAAAQDKLLDFSQRLLTINLDKEDAMAINTATAGEDAFYNTDDKSASKKTLDSIAKKLKDSFSDSNYSSVSNSLSWSLNADSAFDSIDSLAGASTASKSGTELYSAALPICREMAAEVCSESELSVAENGYQLLVEQDCNTVQKSYKTQIEQTRGKILENSALLDMSRLDIYQTRNSDDILTCKTKMLDMLKSSSVCGSDLGKCLDTTGRYIDPSTGSAFLTTDLTQLSNLIKSPTGNQTWSELNTTFVNFLNSKKKYIEPATKNCQNIADDVWDMFIEDAISQIKIAQEAKLEEVRQSCTTLTSQCISESIETVQDFDSRALSIFGISANKTAQTMCADVIKSCNLVMGDTKTWSSGMNEMMAMDLYSKILSTCREVGRNCIIQQCSSMSGNFGLCEDTQYSVNRKSILNRYSCWQEVYNCVDSAGTENIKNILTEYGKAAGYDGNKERFYKKLYGSTDIPQDGICPNNDYTCYLAERIWGNCSRSPVDKSNDIKNRFVKPVNGETTLLDWFGQNTGTDSCTDDSCPDGTMAAIITGGVLQCVSTTEGDFFVKCNNTAQPNMFCGMDNEFRITSDSKTNCCGNINGRGGKDWNNNCCTGKGMTANKGSYFTSWTDNNNVCVPYNTGDLTHVVGEENDKTHLFCLGEIISPDENDPQNAIKCSGQYIVVKNGKYKYLNDTTESAHNYWYDNCSKQTSLPLSGNWIIDLE